MIAGLAISLAAWRRPLPEALDAACACGAHGVDLMAIPSWGQLDPARLADDPDGWVRKIRAELQPRNLTVAALNATVPDPHLDLPAAGQQERRRQAEGLARVAAGLGAQVVSLYPGYHHEGPISRTALQTTCAEWAEIGRSHGVHLAPEIHWKTVAPDPAAALELCAQVPDLRLVLDPSHAIIAGIPLQEWLPLLPRVAHVHLRDATRTQLSVPWGTGQCKAREWLTALTAAGYRGHVTVEYLAGDANPETSVQQALAEIESFFRNGQSTAT